MKKYIEILKKCPLFLGIEEDSLLKMLSCLGAQVEFYDKKYTIIAEGYRAKHIGIVLTGSVQLITVDYNGNRNLLSEVLPSQTFCESFAAAETENIPISVIANEPSYIMLINCTHILKTCSNACGFHHQLIFNLMKDLASHNILLHQHIEIVSGKTTKEKLLRYLNSQAKITDSNSFDIPFDRQELADFLNVDRSGLSNEISKLVDDGIITSKKNHFTIL